nr:hypothetical protein [Tanacetum cinerariifolium]
MKLFLMQLGVLTTELGKSWQNLWSQQQQLVYNLLFWNAEWNKHGGFSEMEGLDYFKKTLDFFKDVGQGLKGTLEAKGIKPVNAQFNPQKTHTLVEIKTARQNINGGFSCTIRCVPMESYILAVQWPPGVCSGVFRSNFTCRIDPVPTNFTIHGLWPKPQIVNLDLDQIYRGKNKEAVKCFKCHGTGHFANACPQDDTETMQKQEKETTATIPSLPEPKLSIKYPEFIHFRTRGIIDGT